jgi:adenylosuccinate synthase
MTGKRGKAVIGAGWGGEGKGLMVNFFASRFGKDCLVVRFNGSAQSSHTVIMPDGRRHVFAHIGSGSFHGAATYLGPEFVCHPILFLKEIEELVTKCSIPEIYVHKNCYVTTPYDMLINQIVEEARGENRHGSCGIGFGETIERTEKSEFPLTVLNLVNKNYLVGVLNGIRRNWLPQRLTKLRCQPSQEHREIVESDEVLARFVDDCQLFLRRINVTSSGIVLKSFKHIVFEGAQGLLLDQNSKFFPYVTRSNTGLKNVLHLVNRAGIDSLEVTYVTRAYMTKHGAGLMPYELPNLPYSKIVDNTNIANAYQGRLRFSYLNLDLLQEVIRDDLSLVKRAIGQIAITCMDQIGDDLIRDNVRFILDGSIHNTMLGVLPHIVSDVCKLPCNYLSFSPVSPEDVYGNKNWSY